MELNIQEGFRGTICLFRPRSCACCLRKARSHLLQSACRFPGRFRTIRRPLLSDIANVADSATAFVAALLTYKRHLVAYASGRSQVSLPVTSIPLVRRTIIAIRGSRGITAVRCGRIGEILLLHVVPTMSIYYRPRPSRNIPLVDERVVFDCSTGVAVW